MCYSFDMGKIFDRRNFRKKHIDTLLSISEMRKLDNILSILQCEERYRKFDDQYCKFADLSEDLDYGL